MRKKVWATGLLAVGAAILVACGSGGKGDTEGEGVTLPESVTTTPSTKVTSEGSLTIKDIEISTKTKDKQCFGSAGCNLELDVRVAFSGIDKLGGHSWDITYEIAKVEDGPAIGTILLNEDGTYLTQTENVQTPTKGTKPTVKVTSVERNGL